MCKEPGSEVLEGSAERGKPERGFWLEIVAFHIRHHFRGSETLWVNGSLFQRTEVI